ncbi:MAG: O-antigen ligase family protein [Planctomycetales bacterium]
MLQGTVISNNGPESIGGGRFALLSALLIASALATEHSFSVSMADAFTSTADEMEAQAAGGNLLRRVAFLAMAAVGVWGLAAGRRPFRMGSVLGGAMLAFVAWSAASVLWSIDPAMTVRRVIVLVCFLLGAAGLARLLSPRELMKLALVCSVVFLAMGVCAEMALGTFRPWAGDYRFAGTQHPNTQGMNLAMLCLASFCLARDGARGRAGLFLLFGIGFAFLILTKSRTSCAAVLVALWPLWLLKYRPQVAAALGTAGTWLVAATVLALMLVGVDVVQETADVALLGRAEEAESLTGRLPIWTELAPYVAARPLAGHGYASFWTPEHIETITETLQWPIREAHSSYIDTVLSVGLVGAAIMAVVVLLAMWQCAARYLETGDGSYGFLFGLSLYCLINAGTESGMTMLLFVSFIVTAGFARLAFCPTEARVPVSAFELDFGGRAPLRSRLRLSAPGRG